MATPSQRISAYAQEAGARQGQNSGLELGVLANNLIPSLKKNLGDLITAITNPIDTVQGVGSVGLGYASKAGIPGLGEFAPYADAMNDMIINRYGSVENAMNTLETDPVGVLMDFSGIAGVGGKLAKISGFEKTGDFVQAAANAVDPANISANAVSAAVGSVIPKKLPENLMAGGMKPTTTLTPDQRSGLLRTAVEQKIMPNEAGVARLNTLVDTFGRQVDGLIDRAVDSGKTVDATSLLNGLYDMEAKLMDGGSTQKFKDVEIINSVRDDLIESIYGRGVKEIDASTPPMPLTAAQLQAIKRDAYARADYKADDPVTNLRNEATKVIGRDARQGIEQLVPGVSVPNRRMGELLELREPLQRSVNRINNRNPISLSQVIAGSAGASAFDAPGAAVGLLASSINSPMNQARLGIGLERMRQVPRNPIRSLMSPAPGRGLIRGGAYAGRNTEGLRNRGLLGR